MMVGGSDVEYGAKDLGKGLRAKQVWHDMETPSIALSKFREKYLFISCLVWIGMDVLCYATDLVVVDTYIVNNIMTWVYDIH